ncbi:MAG: trypsin-like peptidase domain-containing protein [Steroidobacteraceae bacterium]
MAGRQIGRVLGFMAASIVLGLAFAFLIVAWRPELLRRGASIPAVSAQAPPVFTPPPGPPATATPEPVRAEHAAQSYADAVQASAPAVVNIYTAQVVKERIPTMGFEQFFGPTVPQYRQRTQSGLGSGVIVDREGHIVTNHHVIANATQISVQLADGRATQAKVVGRDPDTDLAVLQIAMKTLPVMPLGRSDQVKVGDVVLAIGSPLGLSQTVTHGIVSATGRAQLGVATFESFIQTDAAINVGNSGGALVNSRGELIGINTAVLGKNLGAEGIGVAIPVDLVRGVMREILDHGRVIRGWIGILPRDITATQAQQYGLAQGGVVVVNLYRDSPASSAGVELGDIVLTVDGRDVKNAQDAYAQIARHKPGEKVKLSMLRGADKVQLQIGVIEPPGSDQR